MMHRSLIMAGAAILAFASVAWAHDVVEGVGTQTIITFSGGKVFIDFNVGYSPTAGYETAKKFDRDGNLKLSEEELRTLVEDLKCQVPSRIELSLDGEPDLEKAVLECVDPFVSGGGGGGFTEEPCPFGGHEP